MPRKTESEALPRSNTAQLLTAEVIVKGIRTAISDRHLEISIDRDSALQAHIVSVTSRELHRVVHFEKIGETPLTTWDAVKSSLPRWLARFMRPVATRPIEFRIIHACPHQMIDPAQKHFSWLAQE